MTAVLQSSPRRRRGTVCAAGIGYTAELSVREAAGEIKIGDWKTVLWLKNKDPCACSGWLWWAWCARRSKL